MITDFKRLFDILYYQTEKYPNKKALAHKANGSWRYFSSQECVETVNKISAGLLEMGLQKGDKLALIAQNNSPIWNLLDYGMQQVGMISIPVYPTSSPKEYEHIFNDAEIKYCFVSNKALYEKVEKLKPNLTKLQGISTFSKVDGLPHWEEILKAETPEVASIRDSIDENELATIIYTSGTTGTPKGVMLSHYNIVSNIKSTISLLPVEYNKRALSFLPMSHIFERMVVYTYMAAGMSVYYAEGLDKIASNLQEVKPHFFTSVPRLLEKTYERIIERGRKMGFLRKKLFFWALGIGKQYELLKPLSFGYKLQLKLARALVFRGWRKVLGGNIEGIVVGAAALQPKLGKIFSAAGISIREGYGLTETSPVLCFNRFRPGGVLFGTVGIPIPGVEIQIAEDGEILARGPNIMMGYYKRPDLTAGVIDEDGWFHTGDKGEFVNKHFLKITDRIKELFKTSGGKYVAPQMLENRFRESEFIEQIMVLGNNRQFVSALVLPNFDRLKRWCESSDVHWTGPQFMVINPKVIERMNEEMESYNQGLNKTETIKQFHLIFEPWEVESGELTPTLKLKRKIIAERYQKEIEALYTK